MRTAIRRSPAALLSSRQGAVFIEEAGWEIPASYGNDAAERAAIRSTVAIADITARAKVDVRGAVGGVAPPGVLIARIAEDWAVVLGAPGEEATLLSSLEDAVAPGSIVTDVTHLFAGVALAGPGAHGVLERTTSWDPHTLVVGEATAAPVVDVRSVILRRDLPFPLLEIYVPAEYARYAWSTLFGVIEHVGGGPVGWQALRAEGWR